MGKKHKKTKNNSQQLRAPVETQKRFSLDELSERTDTSAVDVAILTQESTIALAILGGPNEVLPAPELLTEPVPDVTPEMLRELYERLLGLIKACKESDRRFEAALKNANRKEEEAEQAKTQIGVEREVLIAEKQAIKIESDNLKIAINDMNSRQQELDEREARATNGFLERWDSIRAEQTEAMQKDRYAHHAHLAQEKKDLSEKQAKAESRMDTLLMQELDIDARVRVLDRREQSLITREELLNEDHEALRAAMKQEVLGEIEALDQQLRGERAAKDRLKALCDKLQKWKADQEAAEIERGGRSPDQLFDDLEVAKAKIQELQATLREALPASQADDLQSLRRQVESARKETSCLRAELGEKSNQLDRMLVQVGEVESRNVLFTSLKNQNALLKDEHKRLQEEIGALMDAHQADATFEACEKMDEDPQFASIPPRYYYAQDLKELTATIRNSMASQRGTERFYSEEDVRSFMGGLAMSRLMILQGASGTGKTSLPKAFIRAVAGGMEIVEVQAGWRDRHDLLGTYNAFERRFHERPTLKALYEAGTPRYAGKLFFIILDEMNLSPPEYYFADFNSLLESGKEEIELHDRPIDRTPKRVVQGATKSMVMKLPPNVWFIGTANRDETTSTIAPKTYDRSHVMELPARHIEFRTDSHRHIDAPVSHESLLKAFQLAVQNHEQEVKQFLDMLNRISEPLSALGIHPSPRFRAQAAKYVPVILASGGSVGEAADYLLTYRILQHVVERFGVSRSNLNELLTGLKNEVHALDDRRNVWKAITLLERKLSELHAESEDF